MSEAQSAPDAVSPDDYNDIVAKAVVSGIKLINSAFDMKPAALDARQKDRRYEVDVSQVAEEYDEETGRLLGVFRFEATCRTGRRRVLTLRGDYLVTYEVRGECDPAAASLFVQRLGPFAAYPYFRALFGILTSHAGLMAPPLPILAEAPRRIARAEKLRMRTDSPLLDHEEGSGKELT